MSLSMYQASVPVFIHMLGNLSAILGKAAAYAETKKIAHPVLLGSRLAPDMLPLSAQIQIACDSAVRCASRLAGVDLPSNPDTETSIPEFQERIAKSIAFLKSVSAAQIDGSEERTVTLQMRTGEMKFQGQPFLLGFALPNFYFHLTTAYAILRHNGLDIGKADFLGKY
ncbi:DUF1993 domain-containing protein [Melittangium boletus]|uniref:DUF1993 domain-containing protein n=1 Tax=Melittangium boletus DSM 14713 TaxID=1294270 RepID=A0A250IBJ4_9BACT|nr:DUF1993 domain-containing protein [Melittangium boletus]ATB28580.1 hypothetical protein MEBOL_002029 [Melittangium boletus DSM 14713]